MKARQSLLIFTLSILATGITTTEANRVNSRQSRQSTRINQGVRSGELTRKEGARLQRQQRHINRMEKRANSDGTVSNQERRRIEKAQDRASKNIYRQKHDDQNRH